MQQRCLTCGLRPQPVGQVRGQSVFKQFACVMQMSAFARNQQQQVPTPSPTHFFTSTSFDAASPRLHARRRRSHQNHTNPHKHDSKEKQD